MLLQRTRIARGARARSTRCCMGSHGLLLPWHPVSLELAGAEGLHCDWLTNIGPSVAWLSGSAGCLLQILRSAVHLPWVPCTCLEPQDARFPAASTSLACKLSAATSSVLFIATVSGGTLQPLSADAGTATGGNDCTRSEVQPWLRPQISQRATSHQSCPRQAFV